MSSLPCLARIMNSYSIVALFSYLLGSIPFGFLLVKLFKGEDVRGSGSGNIGATNVARKSPVLGVATLLLDAIKGLAAVLITRSLFSGDNLRMLMFTAALFAVLGHIFPLWLKFRGGKGVATTLGAFVVLTPKSILCALLLFLLVTAASRYVSLASVAAAAAFPAVAWMLHEYSDSRQLMIVALVGALVIWKHRQNISRLISGKESKMGRGSAKSASGEPTESAAHDAQPLGSTRP